MNNDGSQQSGTPPGDQTNMPTGGYTPPPGPQQPAPVGSQPQQYGAPQGYMPAPAPAPAPPPKKRSPLFFILLIVGSIILLCGVGGALLVGGVFAATQPVVDAGEVYMKALRDGDYNRAFDLSTSALQQQVGDPAGLETALSSRQPSTWTFTSRSISNNEGALSGTTTYGDGTTGTVNMSLTKVGNDWKVVGIGLK